jgi:uncharacterized membrane protein HdeD (DUF308 family)
MAARAALEDAMFDQLIRRWWIVAARGLVAVAFGVAALLNPENTRAFLVAFFGLFAFADGIFSIGAGLSTNWLTLFLEGVTGIAVGLVTYFEPGAAELSFAYLIVLWAIVTGALEVIGAFRLRTDAKGPMVKGEWLLGVSGIVSLLFGAVAASRVDASAVTFMVIIGAYAVVSGALLLALAVNIRGWQPTQPVARTV